MNWSAFSKETGFISQFKWGQHPPFQPFTPGEYPINRTLELVPHQRIKAPIKRPATILDVDKTSMCDKMILRLVESVTLD